MFSPTSTTRTIAVSLTLSLVALLGFAAGEPTAKPAAAATLPPSDTLFGITCDFVPRDLSFQLFTVDPVTAAGVSLAGDDASEAPYFCGMSSAWAGPADECAAYTVGMQVDGGNALLRTDLVTGLSTVMTGWPAWSIAVGSSGAAWGLSPDGLYSVNLADGSGVLLGAVGDLRSLTVNPTNGGLYAHDSGAVYRIDPATLAVVPVFTAADVWGTSVQLIEGMTIDSAGTFWLSGRESTGDWEYDSDPHNWSSALWSVSQGGASESHGRLMVDGVKQLTLGLVALPPVADCGQLPTLPLPEPDPGTPTPAALAETGSENPTLIIALAGGVTVLGAALLVLASRRRPRQPVRS